MPRCLRPLVLVAVVAVVVIAAVGCGDSPSDSSQATDEPTTSAAADPGAGGSDTVVIKTFIFRPDPNTVDRGATVRWVNQDEILHTVTSGNRDAPDGTFAADLDGVGATFERTFDEAGTYDYFCRIHPGMDAQIVVE